MTRNRSLLLQVAAGLEGKQLTSVSLTISLSPSLSLYVMDESIVSRVSACEFAYNCRVA